MTSSLPHVQEKQGMPTGRRLVSVRQGSGGKGAARRAGRARGRCTSRRDASGRERRWGYAPHLRPISSTFLKYPKSWSGSRRRDSAT